MKTMVNNQVKQSKQLQTRTPKAEKVWRLMAFFVCMAFLILGNKIYLFHTRPQFQNSKKGDPKDIVFYSIPFTIIYIAIDYLLHYLLDGWVEKNYLRTDKYVDKQVRTKKSYTVVKLIYGIIFYTFSSTFSYLLLKNSYYLPPLLGGNGSFYTLALYRYLEHTNNSMRIFYLIQMGKHLARFFMHVFIRPEGSYYEYSLHHALSVFLIFFSYTMNMWVIGIFVLFVHDISDALVGIPRLYREYKVRKSYITNISAAIGFFTWVYMRHVAFAYCIFASWWELFNGVSSCTEAQIDIVILPYAFMIVMLTMLQCLHLFWTYYLAQGYLTDRSSFKAVQPQN